MSNQSQKQQDIIRRYHKSTNCPQEAKIILVVDEKMDEELVAKLNDQPGGHASVMINEGAEIAHIMAQSMPVATLDSLLITLIQLRPAGRLYGEQVPQGEEGDIEVTADAQ